LTKKYFPQFETNLIFLKNISINYKFNDIKFLNYYYFFKK